MVYDLNTSFSTGTPLNFHVMAVSGVELQVRVAEPLSSLASTTINTDSHVLHSYVQPDQHFCYKLNYMIIAMRHTVFWNAAEAMHF